MRPPHSSESGTDPTESFQMISFVRGRSSAVPALVAMTALAACGGRASTGPLPVPTPDAPPPVPPAPTTTAPAPAPRAFAYNPGSYSYELRSEAVTTALDGDRRSDTATTQMVVSFRVEPATDGQLRAIGTVDSFAVRSSTPGAAPATVAAFPFELAISSSGQILTSPSDSAGACATPTSVPMTLVRELIVSVPVTLQPGAAWEDSVRATTCRAMLPITTHSTRRNRVEWVGLPPEMARRSGDAAYRIVRAVSTTVAADTRAAGRQVMVSGAGEGTSAFFIDPIGVLLGASGDVSSQLIVDSGTQRQQFAQTVRARISLRR